jgi:hypothetical protein
MESRKDYLAETGAGAGAGAALGQQEAANNEATAAITASLTSFMMVCQVWLVISDKKPGNVPGNGRTLAGLIFRASSESPCFGQTIHSVATAMESLPFEETKRHSHVNQRVCLQ